MKALFLITTKGIPPLKDEKKWSEEMKDFLGKCFSTQNERPTATQLLEHPFLHKACSEREFADLICRFLILKSNLLWSPTNHTLFPNPFRETLFAFLLALKRQQIEKNLKVPKVLIFEITKWTSL